MKNTRKVIVIKTQKGDFLFGASKDFNIINYSDNIWEADEFETKEEAQEIADWFNNSKGEAAEVKEFKYECDDYGKEVKNVTEII